MFDLLKSNRILRFLVGVLILIAGAGLIYLALIAESSKNNNLQYILLAIGFIIAIFGLYKLYEEYWENEKPDNPIHNDQNISDYSTFVNNLNLDEFDEIILMIHTGRNSLEILRQKIISANVTCNIDIKILLKNPYSETTHRFEQIDNYLQSFINEMNRYPSSTIDHRFYNGTPYFHTILCKYKNRNQYKSYISYYKWKKHRTVACQTGVVIDKSVSELFLVAKSLFEHLFSKKNLHPIVFDLDDTIIDSYNSQIRSWKFLLECIFAFRNKI